MPGSNNSAITYAITAVLGGDLTDFSINSTSGEVTTAIMLDYEAVQSYTITVKASDAGVPPSSRYKLYSEHLWEQSFTEVAFIEGLFCTQSVHLGPACELTFLQSWLLSVVPL